LQHKLPNRKLIRATLHTEIQQADFLSQHGWFSLWFVPVTN